MGDMATEKLPFTSDLDTFCITHINKPFAVQLFKALHFLGKVAGEIDVEFLFESGGVNFKASENMVLDKYVS